MRVAIATLGWKVNQYDSATIEVDHVVGLNRLPDMLGAVRGELAERTVADDLRTARRVKTVGAETTAAVS